MHSFLVILPYYDRPTLLANAVRSVIAQEYPHWHLYVIDDGSPRPAFPIVNRIICEESRQSGSPLTVHNTGMTPEKKRESGGLLGLHINQAIASRNRYGEAADDIALLLCDDDELFPGYLWNLHQHFLFNPGRMAAYSKVLFFDPLDPKGKDKASVYPPEGQVHLNRWHERIAGPCQVDASQVAWHTSVNYRYGCWFPYPQERDQDAGFFTQLHKEFGGIEPTGFIGQYKGVHGKQLGKLPRDHGWKDLDLDAEYRDATPDAP